MTMLGTLFHLVAAGIFGLISFLHIMRIVLGWEVQVGPAEIPFSISWAGCLATGALSVWGFASAGKTGR
jgi:hypothetical protein